MDENLNTIAANMTTSVRTLERLFKKHIGISPKLFYKIRQFEKASHSVLYDKDIKFTEIAYETNYYDQAHFTKVFKQFPKETPKKIRTEKTALKSNMDYE